VVSICACQIILDPKQGTSLFPPGTSNKDIAARLKEAIGNICNDNTPSGYIRAVTTLVKTVLNGRVQRGLALARVLHPLPKYVPLIYEGQISSAEAAE
jgi:hypothetical protein